MQDAIPSNIPKRMRRILANRASAARSKERKKAIVELEEQVAALHEQRQSQDGQMAELSTSNATLGAALAPAIACSGSSSSSPFHLPLKISHLPGMRITHPVHFLLWVALQPSRFRRSGTSSAIYALGQAGRACCHCRVYARCMRCCMIEQHICVL